jgi:predicted aspartyl protease
MVYQCQEAEAEFARIHRMLGLAGAALVCRVTIDMGGKPLVACIDTGATFSLLADKVYEELQGDLPPLQPAEVELSGAAGTR